MGEKYIPRYNSLDELLAQFEPAIGKTFYELDINHRLVGNGNKGVLGQIVEEGVFHYPINSDHNADFPNLGIELKTTGILRKKAGVTFKERVPLCGFDYNKVVEERFENSYLWFKCERLLFALYEYLEGKPYGEMQLIKGFLHVFTPEDIAIIKKDYEILAKKVLSGHPEDISESDTNYLAACTSGAGHGQLDKRASNFFEKPLKPRKYALKAGYMTQVIRKLLTNEDVESIIQASELKKNTIEDIILARLNPYLGKSESELQQLIENGFESKNRFERYVAAMIGAKGKVNDVDEFKKANITLKTIRVEEDGNIEQNMSFPAFSFIDIINEEWEESGFRDLMANQKFLFVIFKKINGLYYFKKTMFWSLPEYILDNDGRKVFNQLKEVLANGNIVKGFSTQKGGKVIRLNNFPKSSANPYFHIRPHGKDASDTNPLPVADKLTGATEYTKQCFWLKKEYVLSVINGESDE